MKAHKDFVIYTRNGVDINALVVFSQTVVTHATQTKDAFSTEHLTLVYLDPSGVTGGVPTGDQIRGNIKVEFSVPPLTDGLVNGWKDVVTEEPVVTSPKSTVAPFKMGAANPLADIASAQVKPEVAVSSEPSVELQKKLKAEQYAAKVPFDKLTAEQRASIIYPTWDGVITESGKTQEQLDAEHAEQVAER